MHGPGWSRWPAALRHPGGAAVAAAVAERADRVAFHAWLQLLLADQLAAAATPGVRLIQDLAIGADPDGADGWMLQDLLALDVSIGAPPDDFAPDGQIWGLPPFVPWRLRDAGYRPLAELLRASMAQDGGLRVDHVMGLSRLFWVPDGGPASAGAYVRFAGRELLEVLAIESQRAGALVVGEDLGTVEDHLRVELAATDVLTTRVVWFEDDPPEAYPSASLGVVTTHDLPTVAGVWTGADEAELAALGRPVPPEAAAEVRARIDALVDLPASAPVLDVVVRAHERLAEGRSVLVLGTLEDLCAVAARPNVPGTTTERANWSQALPLVVEDLPTDPHASRRRRGPAGGPDRPRDGVTSPSGPPKIPLAGHGAQVAPDRYLFRTNPPIGDAPGASMTRRNIDEATKPRRGQGDDGAALLEFASSACSCSPSSSASSPSGRSSRSARTSPGPPPRAPAAARSPSPSSPASRSPRRPRPPPPRPSTTP